MGRGPGRESGRSEPADPDADEDEDGDGPPSKKAGSGCAVM